MYILRSQCRSCGSDDLEVLFTLGELPLPEALILPSHLDEPERRYPLDLALCRGCALVQLMQTVSPSEIYDERYRHLSSASESNVAHAYASAERLIQQRRLDGNSYVVEIGSNDGTMLKHFQTRGVATLAIEPAEVPAVEARRAGIATLQALFTRDLAGRVAAEGRRADVVIAADVLCRVPDLHGFLAGVRAILGEQGVAIVEVPYVRDLVEQARFDAFDHEHLCYFSVLSLVGLLDGVQLTVNHVERFPLHGGMLRAYLSRSPHQRPSVKAYMEEEAHAGVGKSSYYSGLMPGLEQVSGDLRALLEDIKAQGKRIVGYSAGARAITMLNLCNIGDQYLDYVVDANPQKQGYFLPGVQLPVLHTDRLTSNKPDYVLILGTSTPGEVRNRQEAYLAEGGRLILSFPQPALVSR